MKKQEWVMLGKTMALLMVAVACILGLSFWLILHVNMDFEQALNLILVSLIALTFPVLQYGQARWLWHTKDISPNKVPAWMSQQTAHLPKIVKPWSQRLLEVGLQIAAMLLLLWLFGSYATQQYLIDWANHYQLRSGTYLVCVALIGSLPIALLALLVSALLHYTAKRWDVHGLRYQLWRNWLWAYVLSFAICLYIILLAGLMIERYLQ